DAPGAPGHPRWAVCDRLGQRGEEDFPPPDAYFRPGADPFADLPPCNWAFRRDRFAALGGLDEALETDLALAELCARAADAGLPVRAAVGARVYRGADNAAGADPAVALRDAALFAARGARRTGRVGEVLRHFSALASGP